MIRGLATGSAVAALAIAGCGGDSGTTEATTAAEAVDAAAFKDCIFSSSLERGIYQEVKNPAAQVAQVAEDGDAEFFEGGAGSDGLVFFYVPSDPAGAEDLSATVESTLTELAGTLQTEAPKGMTLGAASADTEGGVVFGMIPFSAQGGQTLTDDTRSDVSKCIEETAAS